MNIVHDTLMTKIPGIKSRGGLGSWSTFNAVCCQHNGESRFDTRQRGGLILYPDDSCVYHCFNCKFSASWTPGYQISRKMENLLEWIGTPDYEIKKLKFKAWQIWMNAKGESPAYSTDEYQHIKRLHFKETPLPKGAKSFKEILESGNIPDQFISVLNYLDSRNKRLIEDYNFYWTDSTEYSMNKRVIIPFYWENKIVGYTGRDTSGKLKDRYYSDMQANYIFNTQSIDYDNEYIFVCEGPFDAMAIDGVAMLGDKMTEEQAQWLNNTEKKIIIIPDRVKMGGKLVDSAIEHGWHVSFPIWGDNREVKDAADAVATYGKFYTMLSILQNYTQSKLRISTLRHQLA